MKKYNSGLSQPVVLVIIFILVCIGYYLYQSSKIETVSNETVETTSVSYFEIPEFNLKFRLTDDLKDLKYQISEYNTAEFTSDSLMIESEGACSFGSLGYLSLTEKGSGKKIPTGSFERPHDRCSDIPRIESLQYKLLESLEESVKSATRIKDRI